MSNAPTGHNLPYWQSARLAVLLDALAGVCLSPTVSMRA
jgi:hypothetical protein